MVRVLKVEISTTLSHGWMSGNIKMLSDPVRLAKLRVTQHLAVTVGHDAAVPDLPASLVERSILLHSKALYIYIPHFMLSLFT
jgi:hypothetical protein